MNKIFSLQKLFVCLCLLICMPAAMAKQYQSHESIYKAARGFMRGQVTADQNNQIEIKVGKLDSRLKLKQCGKRLTTFLPKGSRTLGKTTVGVKCADSKPWSLHVPLTINSYKSIMVSARVLQKGDILVASDVKLVKHNIAELPYGYYDDLSSGLGMKLKRRSAAGAVLTPGMLKKPQIISRGQQIVIMAQSGRMQVRMNGKALAGGAVGDRIKIQNIKSKQKMEGVVMSSGEVRVDI